MRCHVLTAFNVWLGASRGPLRYTRAIRPNSSAFTCRLCEAAGRVQPYRVYLIASSWVVVKILLIVVVIAIVAGLYWLLRRSVLRDEQASRQRLKRGIEAWRVGGGVSPPSGFRGTTTAASTTPAATAPGAAEVATTAAATERARAASGELPARRARSRFWQRFGVRDARTDGALGQWARRLGMATTRPATCAARRICAA